MGPLRLFAAEARRVDDYRSARHVSLLALAVSEVADYGALSERLDAEALADALGDFARQASAAVEDAHDGLVVRCGGGELLAVFADPTSAVLACRSLHRGRVALRTGIHVGQVAIERVGLHVDVFGRHMHRAACVAGVAQPGEILVTEPVADNARGWLAETGGPALTFAPRGRLQPEGAADAVELFALVEEGVAVDPASAMPATHIEIDAGDGRRVLFDAGVDRRILIGRAPACDIPIRTDAASRKHAMVLCDDGQWLVCDLQSTNGTRHNGRLIGDRAPLGVGDRIEIGEVVLTVTRLAHGSRAVGSRPRLRVDLVGGTASFDGDPLPLSAAELVWFAYLASARRAGGEGWVHAGQDGHAEFGAFARRVCDRPWAVAVRTRPLLDLMAGREIDDEDLRNLRGKTVQKLKRFAADRAAATSIVPESDGKSRQRVRLPATLIEIVEE